MRAADRRTARRPPRGQLPRGLRATRPSVDATTRPQRMPGGLERLGTQPSRRGRRLLISALHNQAGIALRLDGNLEQAAAAYDQALHGLWRASGSIRRGLPPYSTTSPVSPSRSSAMATPSGSPGTPCGSTGDRCRRHHYASPPTSACWARSWLRRTTRGGRATGARRARHIRAAARPQASRSRAGARQPRRDSARARRRRRCAGTG